MIIEEYARLEVTLPDGRQFDISEDDIIKDSLSLTSQCVNGNTFRFGCVSVSDRKLRFHTERKVENGNNKTYKKSWYTGYKTD